MSACSACNLAVLSDCIECDGVCGKLFHPKCLKRSAAVSGQYTCTECANIKPCHVLRMVKSIVDVFTANQTYVADSIKALCSRLPGLEVISDDIVAFNNKVDSLISNFDHIKDNSHTLLKKSHEMSSRVRLLSDAMDELRDPPSTPHSSQRADTTSLVPLLNDISSQVKVLQKDFATWKVSSPCLQSSNLGSSPRLQLCSSQPIPVPPTFAKRDQTSVNHQEPINSQPSPPVSEPLMSHASSRTSPAKTPKSDASTQTKDSAEINAKSTKPYLVKFGTAWTESEWSARINKLTRTRPVEIDPTATFIIHGVPQQDGVAWVQNFFARTFAITSVSCRKHSPPMQYGTASFKVSIPSRYAWLLRNGSSNKSNFGTINICETSTKPQRNKGSSKSIPKSTTNSSNKSRIYSTNNNRPQSSIAGPLPRNNKVTPSLRLVSTQAPLRPDPNWHLKTGVFPNFSGAVKYPNFTRSQTPSNSLPPTPSIQPTSSSSKYSNFIRAQTLIPIPEPLNPREPSTTAVPTTPHPNSTHTNSLSLNSVPLDNAPPTTSSSTSVSSQPIPSPSPVQNPPSFIDPLLPPVVKLTMQSAASTSHRYLLSRFRDHRIYENVRLYLAYLHNQDSSVCVDGKTKTNVLVLIHQEGLPTEHDTLRQLFYQFHETLNIPSEKVSDDLTTYASFIRSKRISHLQKSRSDFRNYFRS